MVEAGRWCRKSGKDKDQCSVKVESARSHSDVQGSSASSSPTSGEEPLLHTPVAPSAPPKATPPWHLSVAGIQCKHLEIMSELFMG